MKYPLAKLILLFALPGLASCASIPPTQEAILPDINIPPRDINTFIILRDPDVLANSHNNNDPLTLQLINLSGIDIVFPDNFGIRAATKIGEVWTDIANNSYKSGGTVVLPTNKSAPGGILISVLPSIPFLSSPTDVRVVVVGHVVSMTGEEVAAYIDVTLNPKSTLPPDKLLLTRLDCSNGVALLSTGLPTCWKERQAATPCGMLPGEGIY